MQRGTYGCFARRFAFGMPAGVGGAFAVLCGYVSLAMEDGVAEWGRFVTFGLLLEELLAGA